MLVPELGVALLNIPKCGSSTVRQCLQFHADRKKVTPVEGQYINHLTLSELKETAQRDGFNNTVVADAKECQNVLRQAS